MKMEGSQESERGFTGMLSMFYPFMLRLVADLEKEREQFISFKNRSRSRKILVYCEGFHVPLTHKKEMIPTC